MKTLTLGSGFVSQHLPYEVIKDRITTDHKQMADQIQQILDDHQPEVLVNCKKC